MAYDNFGQGRIDSSDTHDTVHDLIREVCRELYARCRQFMNTEEEFCNFWHDLITIFQNHEDPEVGPVARRLLDEEPELHESVERKAVSSAELHRRETLLNKLKSNDPGWYLQYLILLWRYLIKTLSKTPQTP